MFEINSLKFVELQTFIQNEAKPEPKMPYFGILGQNPKEPFSHLKSALLNLLGCKVLC